MTKEDLFHSIRAKRDGANTKDQQGRIIGKRGQGRNSSRSKFVFGRPAYTRPSVPNRDFEG